MASSSSSYPGEEYPNQYPYPSYVCAPNFVTVKLSGRDKYGLWKTQMLCLLKSHDMLGFIYGTFKSATQNSVLGKEKMGDYFLWERSDSLVKGWILGSLSEQTLRYTDSTAENFTAKDLWDELKFIYGPTPLNQQEAVIQVNTISEDAALNEEERAKKREENEQKKIEEAEKRKEEEKKRKEVEAIATINQSLHKAILNQSLEKINSILGDGKVRVTDKITMNGNTALHVAVGTTKKRTFLEMMLNLGEQDNPQLDMRNSEGSTLLHVAAIVGNLEAAKMLVEKNQYLLFAMDKEGHTPPARALSNLHTDTYMYLLESANNRNIEMGPLVAGSSREELLVNAISSKDYASALGLSAHYSKVHSDAVLMAIAQNFPAEANFWESLLFKYWTLSPFKFLEERANLRVKYWTLSPFKFLEERAKLRDNALLLLVITCLGIKDSINSTSQSNYYKNAILEATRQNAYHVVQEIVYYFPDAIWSLNEDGHNIIQYAVINRSENVYNLIYQMSEHRNIYRTIKDSSGNNLLHLAARLAPTNKLNLISGAALQIQRELQWFKEVEKFVSSLNIIQKNSFEETPKMVFTREHKELVIEGEKWMKATAESYTITAALITTIVFAAAITVPGGNKEATGLPFFSNKTAFQIFAVSDAISLFTAVTSLLIFLSILTARFAEQDFLIKLPTKLIIGLATLFISTTSMLVAFGATLFLVFGQRDSWITTPIAILTSLPIISFVTLQFPLIADLMSATYGRSMFGKKRDRPFY